MNDEPKRFSDMISVRQLQDILSNCSLATGFAFVAVDYRGAPITEYFGFTRHCSLMRCAPPFADLCKECDAHGGLQAAITGQPAIYLCHAGLMDFAVPLIANGSYVGAILGGQARPADADERRISPIIPKSRSITDISDEMLEAYAATEIVSYQKVVATINILKDMLPSSLKTSDRSIEIGPGRRELSALRSKDSLRYLFFALNLIARTAGSEKARKTESVVLDLSDMMRYAVDTAHTVTTLGEELNYVRLMYRMTQPWSEDALAFSIDVGDDVLDLPCPFMMMQPIMENAMYGAGDMIDSRREISIRAGIDGPDAIVSVKVHDEFLNADMLKTRLQNPLDEDRLTMKLSDGKIKRMFGEGYGISFADMDDGRQGCEIIVRIPRGGEVAP